MEERGFEWRSGRFLPWRELTFRSDPSGGPGGQHANRSATRVTLTWRPVDSTAFSEQELSRLLERLAPRLSREGLLRLRSSEERSARRNREECLRILGELLRKALAPRKRRVATRPSRASRERRLEEKRRRSRTKETRRPPAEE